MFVFGFYFATKLHLPFCCRLERTAEFLIYGHGQQRRAIIEAVRLLENEKNRAAHKTEGNFNGRRNPEDFKDKSKKWQKFVTKVSYL